MLLLDAAFGKVFSNLIALGCRSLLNRRVFSFCFLIEFLSWNELFSIRKSAWFKYWIEIPTKKLWQPASCSLILVPLDFRQSELPCRMLITAISFQRKKTNKRNTIKSCIYLYSLSWVLGKFCQFVAETFFLKIFRKTWSPPFILELSFFWGSGISCQLPVFGHSFPYNWKKKKKTGTTKNVLCQFPSSKRISRPVFLGCFNNAVLLKVFQNIPQIKELLFSKSILLV